MRTRRRLRERRRRCALGARLEGRRSPTTPSTRCARFTRRPTSQRATAPRGVPLAPRRAAVDAGPLVARADASAAQRDRRSAQRARASAARALRRRHARGGAGREHRRRLQRRLSGAQGDGGGGPRFAAATSWPASARRSSRPAARSICFARIRDEPDEPETVHARGDRSREPVRRDPEMAVSRRR